MAVLITTVANIEAATGKDLSTAEESRATYYINAISAYVASYCNLITLEEVVDDTKRWQADYYGIIELGGGPISSVTSVADVDGTEVVGWTFDNFARIQGLKPYHTVDVTYSHGSDELPEDLVYVVTDAVIQSLELSPGFLKTRTVGDVTYAFSEGNVINVSLSAGILNRYRATEYTLRTGPMNNDGIDYPINWYQVGR